MTQRLDSIERIYLEPTNACNLTCRTCVRNVWQEPSGWMSVATFDRIVTAIGVITPRPLVFFGGFGEPLGHPRIVEMVAAVRQAGAPVELITNGILLTPQMTADLAQAGLNCIWVSIDGASSQSYTDVRLGDALPLVIENLSALSRQQADREGLRLGVAFVAMRRNMADLPAVIQMGRRFGADRFSITNVLPYTLELQTETLYRRSLYRSNPVAPQNPLGVDLPPFDPEEVTQILGYPVCDSANVLLDRPTGDRSRPVCPFFEKGSLSVRWDGEVAPCLPLLHDHSAYLDDRLRRSVSTSFGNVAIQPLLEIWRSGPYCAFRDRLEDFDFSPCVMCNACEMADANLEDCFGNVHPTCGGCLWAAGFIRCP